MTTTPNSVPDISPAGPLGPDSLTWKYFGDLRTGMLGVWIGAIQNMYPELGAAVEEHRAAGEIAVAARGGCGHDEALHRWAGALVEEAAQLWSDAVGAVLG